MGQKVNPIGLRLGTSRKWKSNWFLDSFNYTNFLAINNEINIYFLGILRNNKRKAFLSHCIISKYSLEKIYVFVFFYRFRLTYKELKLKEKNDKDKKKSYLFLYQRKNKNYISNFSESHKFLSLLNNKNKILLDNKQYKNFSKKTYKIKNLKKKKLFKYNKSHNLSLNNVKKSLKLFLNTNVSLLFINFLSFTRFHVSEQKQYQILRKKEHHKNIRRRKQPGSLFFKSIEYKLFNFFKYDVKLITDAIPIAFISLLLKQPETLTRFIGYHLRSTPKNRRQTKLIQFYKRLLLIIIKLQPEIKGLRIKFKGRINGRKRAKSTIIDYGNIPLRIHNEFIEYGESKGITIYGVIGIKIWIFYDKNFNDKLQTDFLKYFNYNKILKTKNLLC